MARPKPEKRKQTRTVYDRPYWFDRARSLCELHGWPRSGAGDELGLIGRHTAAVNKPVGRLTTHEIVMLFGQQTGPHFLAPIALERAADDDDLLRCLVTLDRNFWTSHRHLRDELVRIARDRMRTTTTGEDDPLAPLLSMFLDRHG